jgi:hypothetical protein
MSTHERLSYVCMTPFPFAFPLVSSISNSSFFVPRPSPLCAHFLPDFLMPWEPVLSGPLPPLTLPASSSRAFLSVCTLLVLVSYRTIFVSRLGVGVKEQRLRTGSELRLVRDIILIEVLRLLLGLLVVNWVCTGYFAQNVSAVLSPRSWRCELTSCS